MESRDELRRRIKMLLVENLMLQISVDEIADDAKLFGPHSLGLDSVDALQIVVALEKKFALRIPNAAQAKEVLASIASLTQAVEAHLSTSK